MYFHVNTLLGADDLSRALSVGDSQVVEQTGSGELRKRTDPGYTGFAPCWLR